MLFSIKKSFSGQENFFGFENRNLNRLMPSFSKANAKPFGVDQPSAEVS